MNWKTIALRAVPVAALVGSASAAVTPDYASGDLAPMAISFLGALFAGLMQNGVLMGTALGLSIALGLLMGVVVGVLVALTNIKKLGKHLGG
jgi:hypothetical protein